MEPNMDIDLLQSALDQALDPRLDELFTADYLTQRQWLQQQIDRMRSGETLDQTTLQRWNRLVPEQYHL